MVMFPPGVEYFPLIFIFFLLLIAFTFRMVMFPPFMKKLPPMVMFEPAAVVTRLRLKPLVLVMVKLPVLATFMAPSMVMSTGWVVLFHMKCPKACAARPAGALPELPQQRISQVEVAFQVQAGMVPLAAAALEKLCWYKLPA